MSKTTTVPDSLKARISGLVEQMDFIDREINWVERYHSVLRDMQGNLASLRSFVGDNGNSAGGTDTPAEPTTQDTDLSNLSNLSWPDPNQGRLMHTEPQDMTFRAYEVPDDIPLDSINNLCLAAMRDNGGAMTGDEIARWGERRGFERSHRSVTQHLYNSTQKKGSPFVRIAPNVFGLRGRDYAVSGSGLRGVHAS